MDQFDIIVIGTGPAGEGAAMMATKNRKRVAVIERHAEVGGGCTHWGTIPSKALRHAVKTLGDALVVLGGHHGCAFAGRPAADHDDVKLVHVRPLSAATARS